MDASDILIIKTDVMLSSEVLRDLHNGFVNQMKTGVVLIPAFFEAKLIHVPENVEVVIESKGEKYGLG